MGHLNGCVTSTSVFLLIKVQYLLCVLLLFCGKNTLIFNPSLLFLFLYFPKYTSVKFDWSNVTCLVCKLTEVKRSPSCQWLHFLLKITVVLDWICECLEIIVKIVPNTTQIPCTVKFCMSEKSYVQSWRPCNMLTSNVIIFASTSQTIFSPTFAHTVVLAQHTDTWNTTFQRTLIFWSNVPFWPAPFEKASYLFQMVCPLGHYRTGS